jgi:hypothetical protein
LFFQEKYYYEPLLLFFPILVSPLVLCTDVYVSDHIQMCQNSVLIHIADEMQVSSMFFPDVCLVKVKVLYDLCPVSLGKHFAALEVKSGFFTEC